MRRTGAAGWMRGGSGGPRVRWKRIGRDRGSNTPKETSPRVRAKSWPWDREAMTIGGKDLGGVSKRDLSLILGSFLHVRIMSGQSRSATEEGCRGHSAFTTCGLSWTWNQAGTYSISFQATLGANLEYTFYSYMTEDAGVVAVGTANGYAYLNVGSQGYFATLESANVS